FIALLLPTIYLNPHYAAPMTGLIYLLLMLALKRIRRWHWRDKPVGSTIARFVPTAALALLAVSVTVSALHFPIHNAPTPETWCSPWLQLLDRARVQSQMEKLPGRQLVLVHYGPQHSPTE